MPTTPAGPLMLAQDYLRTMLANCTYFRTWQGAAYTVDQAKARIYHDALPAPASGDALTAAELATYRPFVIISTERQQGFRLRHDSSGDGFYFSESGRLCLLFEQAVPSAIAADPSEVEITFKNFLGRVMASNDTANPGLAELAGEAGYLAIEEMVLYGPYRSAEDDQVADGDCQLALIEIAWGAPQ